MVVSAKEKWNKIYSSNEFGFFPPAPVLHQHAYLLPQQGTALDLACGMGRNAVFLAQRGFQAHAIDVSDTAIEKLADYAKQQQLAITTEVSDLEKSSLQKDAYEVIVISHYLNRQLIPNIKNALKDQGLIYYQTFIQDKVDDIGPSNPDYRLAKNELLKLFKDYQIVLYREEASIGDTQQGFRNEAMLIARKD